MGVVVCNPADNQIWEVYCIGCRKELKAMDKELIVSICRKFDQGVFCDNCAANHNVLNVARLVESIRASESHSKVPNPMAEWEWLEEKERWLKEHTLV